MSNRKSAEQFQKWLTQYGDIPRRICCLYAQGEADPPEETDDARKERVELLYTAIGELSRVERSLILLSLDGLSHREISEISGLTESNVGARLTRTRQKLARIIEEIES